MNPSLKLLLLLTISIEVSFTSQLTANVVLAVVLLVILVSQHLRWHQLLWSLGLPLIPGIAVMITLGVYSGHNWFLAWVMLSRFYVYVLAGSELIFTTSNLALVRSLEQNAHLSSKFAYGTLAALNIFPTIRHSVSRIRVACQMRGCPCIGGRQPSTSRRFWRPCAGLTSWPKQWKCTVSEKGNHGLPPRSFEFGNGTGVFWSDHY